MVRGSQIRRSVTIGRISHCNLAPDAVAIHMLSSIEMEYSDTINSSERDIKMELYSMQSRVVCLKLYVSLAEI